MAHMVEKMVFAHVAGSKNPLYQVPWHYEETKNKNAFPVSPDADVLECAEKTGSLFEVEKVPQYIKIDGKEVATGSFAIINKTNRAVLTEGVKNGWEPHPNETMFELPDALVKKGFAELNTLGHLDSGRVVFTNLVLKDTYIKVLGKDDVHANLLFTNFHQYGKSADVRNTAIRAVCRNTVEAALRGDAKMNIRFTHNNVWDDEKITDMLAISKKELELFGEAAEFLGSKKFKKKDLEGFYKKLFPLNTNKDEEVKKMSKKGAIAYGHLDSQPGAEVGKGTWWQAFNSVTFTVDHLLSKTENVRLRSAMYGYGREKKREALSLAMDLAKGKEVELAEAA